MNTLSGWSKLSIHEENNFRNRWGHSAINHKKTILIFGDTYMDQLFIFNCENLNLYEIQQTLKPSPRSNHSCVKFSDENNNSFMVIHGGSNNIEELNDTFIFDLQNFTWKKIETFGDSPPKSTEHSAEVYKDYMIVIGGESNEDLHSNIRVLNLKTFYWKIIRPPQTYEDLFMRIFHGSVIIDYKLYIYSGSNVHFNCFNDFIILDLENFDFENVSKSIKYEILNFDNCKKDFFHRNRYPYPRWGFNMLVFNKKIVLFGGRNKKDFNDLWLFCPYSSKWVEITSPGIPITSRRKSASVIVDDILFIIGGYNDEFLSDFNMINLKKLEIYKSYIQKSLINIEKEQKDNKITFKLKEKNISFSRSFFLKKINLNLENNFGLLNKFYSNENTTGDISDIIIDLSENNFSEKNLKILYEITLTGRICSYINIKELENLILLSEKLNLKNIKKKLISLNENIKELYIADPYLNKEKEIFNFTCYNILETKHFHSKDFYYLKNPSCESRRLISIYSKILLKFLDCSKNKEDFFGYISEKTFKFILNYIYNQFIPKIDRDYIINDHLEILFFAKFFKIKSLFKVNFILF